MTDLLLLAVGLAMDAFAVALVRGAVERHRISRGLLIALVFGAAQGLMPLLGWALGVVFTGWIEAWDHWIAFALLSFLGLRMIYEAWSDEDAADDSGGDFGPAALLVAALATSIDAAAAGLTLPMLATSVWVSCTVIGAVTAALCFVAYLLGGRVSAGAGKAAEYLGGLVLIGLGVKILLSHLGAA